jgi:multiple sugar transport system permease protein
MISPAILFITIMSVIGSFQVFTQAYIMTGGGPANATLFYLLYLYRNAFSWFEMGYASALAWVLFLVVLVCTLITMRGSQRLVHYEGA